MKGELAIAAMHEWGCYAINANLHPIVQSAWLADNRDIREEIRERLRKEVKRQFPHRDLEYVVVLESKSKSGKSNTKLHIHGAFLCEDPTDATRMQLALLRAFGHELRGREHIKNAVKLKPYRPKRNMHGVDKWGDYMFKGVTRGDRRIDDNRVIMSRPLTQGTQQFYELITGVPLPKSPHVRLADLVREFLRVEGANFSVNP